MTLASIIPLGLCQCGCGRATTVSDVTHRRYGWVKGQPKRFVLGHRGGINILPRETWPDQLCACGCGGVTNRAQNTSTSLGWIKGKPQQYLPGHHARKNPLRLVEQGDDYYRVDPESGCWVWFRSRDNHGYGKVRYQGKSQPAHRVLYELLRGPIPVGLDLDHRCNNPACVNPEHLQPVTTKRNLQLSVIRRGEMTKEEKLAVIRELRARYAGIEAEYAVDGETGCWIWLGSMLVQGYGRVNMNYKSYKAHRVVYEREVGQIPNGYVLDHLCELSICVNPAHLEPVTRAENARRRWARNRLLIPPSFAEQLAA